MVFVAGILMVNAEAGSVCAPTRWPPTVKEDEYCVMPQFNACNFEACDYPLNICCRVISDILVFMCDEEGNPGDTFPCVETERLCGPVYYRPCNNGNCEGEYGPPAGDWWEISCVRAQ